VCVCVCVSICVCMCVHVFVTAQCNAAAPRRASPAFLEPPV
jgi:hypothetical protein